MTAAESIGPIVVTTAGTIAAIYGDHLADLIDAGTATTRRASHVEPVPGGWTADMSPVGGPVLLRAGRRPFRLRSEALDAERAYLADILAAGDVPGVTAAAAARRRVRDRIDRDRLGPPRIGSGDLA